MLLSGITWFFQTVSRLRPISRILLTQCLLAFSLSAGTAFAITMLAPSLTR